MAFLTPEEFGAAIGVLAEHHGVERLRERFARMNAFTSRRGLNSATAIADRLFALSGGLRRQVAATLAFSSLWQELVGARLGDAGEKRLETLAEEVNACLAEDESIVAGEEGGLGRPRGATCGAPPGRLRPPAARRGPALKGRTA